MVVIIQSPRDSFSVGKMALMHYQWMTGQEKGTRPDRSVTVQLQVVNPAG